MELVNSKCVCDTTYIEPDCVYFPYKVNQVAYISYYYPMTLAFFGLLLATSYRVYEFLRTFESIAKWKEEFSVRHLAVVSLWFGLLARNIFNALNLDMDWNRNVTGFFPFFLYIFYPFICVAFTCELLLWLELYSTTTLHNIEKLPHYKKWLIIFNAIVFPIEVVLRILIVSDRQLQVLNFIWFLFLGVLVLTETIGFLIVGSLLLRKVMRMQSVTGQEQQKAAFTKLTRTLIVQTCIVLIACVLFAITAVGGQNADVFFAAAVCARFVESVAVVFMLVLLKPPPRQGTTLSSTQPQSKSASVEKSNSDNSEPNVELYQYNSTE
mmetsp:Transcript_14441/g.20134  ORF Transcript_14441/g.20134 Transcript_14441/m.20134 type:complete len:324 (-) Transcript_14441:38-1009(-)